jgi:hypothetical protein
MEYPWYWLQAQCLMLSIEIFICTYYITYGHSFHKSIHGCVNGVCMPPGQHKSHYRIDIVYMQPISTLYPFSVVAHIAFADIKI